MKYSTDSSVLFNQNVYLELLETQLPRFLSQIDRDPDSPTFGSCDRGFWMYRLHDFDSGVLQQGALALAALALIQPEHNDYYTALARAINTRTVKLLEPTGSLDEYYPGEQSFPATVFSTYAVLKSSSMLGFNEIISSPGLRAAARFLLEFGPSPAANQDTAAAAFLALYSKLTGWKVDAVEKSVANLLTGPDGSARFLEYGGVDFGYATVTLNYLACMNQDQSFEVSGQIGQLAQLIADFVTPAGRLGGEFASRSTTYFLPFGLIIAASKDPELAARVSHFNLLENIYKLDDRYLAHYVLPSLTLSAAFLLESSPIEITSSPQSYPRISLHEDCGVVACNTENAALHIGLNKGGTFQLEAFGKMTIDTGYRLMREGESYSTAVIGEGMPAHVESNEHGVTISIKAPFQRYRNLIASPAKTIIIRLLRFFGRSFNAYFKKRLIKNTIRLDNVFLNREIKIEFKNNKVVICDHVSGLSPTDKLHHAPPSSPRLVPSAKFYQKGEEAFSFSAIKTETKSEKELLMS